MADIRLLAVTPPGIWLASNAISYTLVKSVSKFLNEPWMPRPYRDTQAQLVGEDLLEVATASNDGLADFRRVTDAWTDRLGLRGWYEWRRLGDLPKGRPVALE